MLRQAPRKTHGNLSSSTNPEHSRDHVDCREGIAYDARPSIGEFVGCIGKNKNFRKPVPSAVTGRNQKPGIPAMISSFFAARSCGRGRLRYEEGGIFRLRPCRAMLESLASFAHGPTRPRFGLYPAFQRNGVVENNRSLRYTLSLRFSCNGPVLGYAAERSRGFGP